MERLKSIKSTLLSCAEGQMTNLANVDAKELGEVIDMVKDLEEAIYYKTITKVMEENEKEKGSNEYRNGYYQPQMMYYYEPEPRYRMYYRGEGGGRGGSSSSGGNSSSSSGSGNSSGRGNSSGGNNSSNSNGGNRYSEQNPPFDRDYRDWDPRMQEYPYDFRDYREGKSSRSRKMYMESKETHQDKQHQMKELEHYIKELSDDLVEMIRDSSQEEKELLGRKMQELSEKVR